MFTKMSSNLYVDDLHNFWQTHLGIDENKNETVCKVCPDNILQKCTF